ncbi:MAG: hypothetical protein ACK4TI_00085 [Nitrososphaerales archaeon]
MGRSPGAVTAPLTAIYILLKLERLGNQKAIEFFSHSGERERHEELRGAPEYLIIFTSKDIIMGLEPSVQVKSKLFPNEKFEGSVIKILCKYLNKLTASLGLSGIYGGRWVKKIYLVKVDYHDFERCYPITNTFLYACRSHECWINSQAGTNQINTALVIAGSINLASIKYYYVRQTEVELLDLNVLEPRVLKAPEEYVDRLPDVWGELQLFGLGLGDLLRRLDQTFQSREIINISELEEILQECNLDKSFMSKLKPFIEFRNNSVKKTERLDKLFQTYSGKWPSIDDASKLWKKASREGILYEIDIQTCKVGKVEPCEKSEE